MIRIRKATIEDAAHIAEGIYHAFLLDDNELHNHWIKILKDVCSQEDTHYSYTNTVVAELDGERAGMMIIVDGKHYLEQRNKMYPQLKDLFDVAFGIGWDQMEDEAKPGEYYIDSLSVAPRYRHRGVGTALIEYAKKQAKSIGRERVTLAVEPMNTAKELYQRLGFEFEREITIFNEVYHLYVNDFLQKICTVR